MTDQRHDPNTLADALDRVLPPGSTQPPSAEENDPLVNAAAWVASAPRPGLPDHVKADIQAKLIQQVRQTPPPTSPKILRPNFQPLLRWALVASVVLAIMATGVPVTLASVPGDVFYPVKQALEQVENRLASSPLAQASLRLTHAERRLEEVQTLLGRGQFEATLITAALDQMAAAAQIARSEPHIPPQTALELETQTAQIYTTMTRLLDEASQMEPDIQSSAFPLMTVVAATQSSGDLLRSETATATPNESAAPVNSPTATMTLSPTSTPTQTATPVPTESPTATPTLEINLVISGPVQAIDGNIVVIYGIRVELDADDPILAVLKVGDKLRVVGNSATFWNDEDTIVNSTVEAELADETITSDGTTGDDQEIWTDNGTCDNPPPAWAPAGGWRDRCEGQSQTDGSSASSDDNSLPPGLQDNPGQDKNADKKNK